MTDAAAPPDWTAMALALARPLAQAAGAGTTPVSIALEFASVGASPEGLESRAWVERGTRTLLFLGAEARTADGALAAAATAVFRRG